MAEPMVFPLFPSLIHAFAGSRIYFQKPKGVCCVKMTNHLGKAHKTCALVGGGLGLLSSIIVASAVGSPLPVLRVLGADAILPPIWLMGLLWLAGYALLGAAAGYVLACLSGGPCHDTPLWKGLTFWVVEFIFPFVWYCLSFGPCLLFRAGICLLIGVAAGVVCTLSWFRVYRLPALLCGGVTLWMLYLLLCHLVVVLHS